MVDLGTVYAMVGGTCGVDGGADRHRFDVGANAIALDCIVGRGGGPQEMVWENIDHENQANYAVNAEIC